MIVNKRNITLIDFDGVIYRNTRAHKIISQRILQYVQKSVKSIRNNQDLSRLNEYLYKTYGHTVIGLNKLGYNINIHDFNDYVYSELPYSDICMNEDIVFPPDTFLFSNAPEYYCNKISKQTLPNVRHILPFYCDSFFLKPEKRIYTQISQLFAMYDITFIDDSFINLKPVIDNEQWTPILFNNDIKETYTIGKIKMSNSLLGVEFQKFRK